MILIYPDHRPLQNILWRENSNSSIQCLQLQTVTYGLKSSPFLATRCLVDLAHAEESKFPLASRALLNNTYVDDMLSGGDTIEEVNQLKAELINVLKLRSFELHKWYSNHPTILKDIPLNIQHLDEIDINKNNTIVKTLGLAYNTRLDTFTISSPIRNIKECITKRQVA
ncbi:hypothetical protein ILUMI_13348 [Ignelater luminosus]|uniref:Reverse transcriptase domain-containing protein n=1 Tax=Ignelater luminosus TaxID=2038154 RepID=A0A8K0CWW5_IGNLU|nr:hypothetical protein ILUMI_13348 [Ignelater luminosus]